MKGIFCFTTTETEIKMEYSLSTESLLICSG